MNTSRVTPRKEARNWAPELARNQITPLATRQTRLVQFAGPTKFSIKKIVSVARRISVVLYLIHCFTIDSLP